MAETLYDVAISYAGENRRYAEALAAALKARGLTVFYDRAEDAELYGANLQDRLWDIYRNRARHCVIILSEHYGNDSWTRVERRAAEARALTDDQYILPVKVGRGEISGMLSTLKYLEWPPSDQDYIADLILSKLNGVKLTASTKVRSLGSFLNYIPLSGVLGIPIFVAVLYSFYEIDRKLILTALLLFAICWLWLLFLAQKAYHAFGTTTEIPEPGILWQIIFNQLAPQKGESYEWRGAVNILVIFDKSTRAVFDSILHHYINDKVQIHEFEFGPKFTKASLQARLTHADAVYLFSTEEMQKSNEPYSTVNEWGKTNSHKPVLAVDFLAPDAPYNWTFEHIPQEEAVRGLWKLLARSTERASQLRSQASGFRWIWGVTICIALIYCAMFGLSLFGSSKRITQATRREADLRKQFDQQNAAVEQSDRMDQNDLDRLRDLHNSMGSMRDGIQSLLVGKDRTLVVEKTPQALDTLARFVVEDLRRRQSVDDTGSISFWREYQEDNKTYVAEVARSDNTKKGCFKASDASNVVEYPGIVTCAVEGTSFVNWRRDLKENDAASWSKHGEINGHWRVDPDQKGFLQLENGGKCRYLEREHKRTGVMCLGAESGALKSGVCLSNSLTHGFPRQEWTKHYLYQIVSVMQVIPNELLITDERRAKCKESK